LIIFDVRLGGGIDYTNNKTNIAKVKKMEIHCLELSPSDPRYFTDLEPPAFDGDVEDFL
jgi:hypothetical protein